MTITMRTLLEADVDGVYRMAARFEALAQLVDVAVSDYTAATRDLPHYWWGGSGSIAAQRQDDQLREQLATAYQPLDITAQLIREAAGDFADAQHRLRSVIAEAATKGISVDVTDGSVSGPAQPMADPVIGLQAAESTVGYYLDLLTQIMDRVNSDDRTHSNLITQPYAPGGLALQAVAPQPADIRRLNGSAESNAGWWETLNPITREQLVTTYPELIGAAPGLPARYRDMANRILLQRRRTMLTAQLNREDGRSSVGLQRMQQDLAAANHLQQQLDDGSHRYLVDYRPGDEQHTTLTTG